MKKAHLLVFDGLADWETPLAMCEIAKSGKFEVQSVGFSKDIVTTMGGLKIVPDVTIEDVKPSETAIFLMPGGDSWEQQSFPEITKLLQTLHRENVPFGAICGATLQIARAGLTKGVRHTSNDKEYLKAIIPEYADGDFYVNELAVTDKNIITANGVGSVEFGREVIKILGIYDEKMTEAWFNLFKHAVWDESMRDS